MSIVKLTSESFEETVLKSDKPYVVDFWAEWCGPCKMLSPVIDELAGEYGDRMNFGKVNIDEEPMLAMEYRIMSIPTIAIYQNGEVVQKAIGVRDKEEYVELFDKILNA